MSEEQQPVSREMWYQSQVAMRDTVNELKGDVKDIRSDVRNIVESVDKILIQTTKTNGRVTALEALTSEVKNYATDKARLWGGVAVLMVVGGAVITLSIMAINSKIKEGINEALSAYNIEVK